MNDVDTLLREIKDNLDKDNPDLLTKQRIQLAILYGNIAVEYAKATQLTAISWEQHFQKLTTKKEPAVARVDRIVETAPEDLQARTLKYKLKQIEQVLNALASRINILSNEYNITKGT